MNFIFLVVFQLLMSQNSDTQPTLGMDMSNTQISKSIEAINELMAKINQTVIEHQNRQKEENLFTEIDDTELLEQLKVKLSRIKMPYKPHLKDKLSTVIEQSFTQSEKTSLKMITPRDDDIFAFNNEQPQTDFSEEIEKRLDHSKKKIMGIRKATSLKSTLASLNKSNTAEPKTNKQPLNSTIAKKVERTSQQNFRKNAPIQQISIFTKNDKSACVSRSKGKKGLSVYSKRSLQSEESSLADSTAKNTKQNTLNDLLSNQKAPQETQKRKRSIKPFVVKVSQKQTQKENRNKTCLSRTNLRDFYTSKRVWGEGK